MSEGRESVSSCQECRPSVGNTGKTRNIEDKQFIVSYQFLRGEQACARQIQDSNLEVPKHPKTADAPMPYPDPVFGSCKAVTPLVAPTGRLRAPEARFSKSDGAEGEVATDLPFKFAGTQTQIQNHIHPKTDPTDKHNREKR